jgi:ATP-binding cassette, subfamily B, heavy metal transporter
MKNMNQTGIFTLFKSKIKVNRQHKLRYRETLEKYVNSNQRSQISLAILNIGQASIIAFGQFVVMILTAYEVTRKERGITVGDFVLINTYMLQLYGPLNFLGTSYR